MSLSGFSKKSQFAVLPLGLGGVLGVLCTQAIADTQVRSQIALPQSSIQDNATQDSLIAADVSYPPTAPTSSLLDLSLLDLSFLDVPSLLATVEHPKREAKASHASFSSAKSPLQKLQLASHISEPTFSAPKISKQEVLKRSADHKSYETHNAKQGAQLQERSVKATTLAQLLDTIDSNDASKRPKVAEFTAAPTFSTAPLSSALVSIPKAAARPASSHTHSDAAIAQLADSAPANETSTRKTGSEIVSLATMGLTGVSDGPTHADRLAVRDRLGVPLAENEPAGSIASLLPHDAVPGRLSEQSLKTKTVAAVGEAEQSDPILAQLPQPSVEPDFVEPDSVEPEDDVPSLEDLKRTAGGNEDASDDLGIIRAVPTRSRQNDPDLDEDLGIIRTVQTARAAAAPKQPTAFLTGRLGFFDTNNALRRENIFNNQPFDNEIYQAGLSLLFFPKLSETTNLYAIVETNIARYGDNVIERSLFVEDAPTNQIITPNYNEVETQIGLRQKLFPRTFAQIGWRNQLLFNEGYRKREFTANYIDAQLSHRAILGSRTWLDGFYQARLGFTSVESADKFRQTFTLSLNHRFTRDFRTSVLYQLDLSDFTQVRRYDTYQQVLGIVSYNITPESRISVFGGTRFGRSSDARFTLDDTFYGAGLNVTVPLF